MSTFYGPIPNPGPHTECISCGEPRRLHDKHGICRARAEGDHVLCLDERGRCLFEEANCPALARRASVRTPAGVAAMKGAS